MAFLFYFSQWLAVDQGKPAWWYNAALIISSALTVFTAPFVSKKIDATGKKIGGLRFWTVLTLVGYVTVALLAMLTDGFELLATILYTLATYAYLVSFLYFTPMLNDLSTQENRSWRSGIGQGANATGQVVGILIALPFANGLTLFGDPGRAQALLPATIIFGLLALPMLLWYRDKPQTKNLSVQSQAKLNIFTLLKEVFSHKTLALILLSYFLFSDALLTFANNFPLYLETVHHASDTTKSLLTASILILGALGSLIFGKIADKKGRLPTLTAILGIWVILFFAMALIIEFKILIPIFLFAGIMFGPVWSISRALVGDLAPPHLVASSYSYYVVAERFATFTGPLLWSFALITQGEDARGYQVALLFMMGLVVISLFTLRSAAQAQKI